MKYDRVERGCYQSPPITRASIYFISVKNIKTNFMSDLNKKNLPLPEQTEGSQKDIQDSLKFSTIQDAHAFYLEAKNRLLDVNQWGDICGEASATFELTDEKGTHIDGVPKVGTYFKIDVPGPGTVAGKGFDWVKVEEVTEKTREPDMEFMLMRVRPASDPTSPNESTAHFFSEKATSNFLALRENLKVTVAVLGRNEVANTKEDDSFLDKIRNFVVGTSAQLGMADPQWESLVKGVLAD